MREALDKMSSGIDRFEMGEMLEKMSESPTEMREAFDKMSEAQRAAVVCSRSTCNGYTPLHIMYLNAQMPEVAAVLLDYGADTNARATDDYDKTPLLKILTEHYGSSKSLSVVQLLLSRGADTSARRSGPPLYALETALHCCTHIDLARCLLDNGADVNMVKGNGNTLLMDVVKDDCLDQKSDFVELLLTHKADVNIQNADGDTALHLCLPRAHSHGSGVSKAKPVHAARLITAGANANIANNLGQTADGKAAGRPSPVSFFQLCSEPNSGDFEKAVAVIDELEAAKDAAMLDSYVNFKGGDNITPLMEAVGNNCHSDPLRNTLVERLLKAGANAEACSSEGESVVDWASMGLGWETNNAQVLQLVKGAFKKSGY